jgi:hypothetical protein
VGGPPLCVEQVTTPGTLDDREQALNALEIDDWLLVFLVIICLVCIKCSSRGRPGYGGGTLYMKWGAGRRGARREC